MWSRDAKRLGTAAGKALTLLPLSVRCRLFVFSVAALWHIEEVPFHSQIVGSVYIEMDVGF